MNVRSLIKEAEEAILRREMLLAELVDLAVRDQSVASEKVLTFAEACGHPGKLLNIEVNSWISRRMATAKDEEIAEARRQEHAAYLAWQSSENGRAVRDIERVLHGVLKGNKLAKKEALAILARANERAARMKKLASDG